MKKSKKFIKTSKFADKSLPPQNPYDPYREAVDEIRAKSECFTMAFLASNLTCQKCPDRELCGRLYHEAGQKPHEPFNEDFLNPVIALETQVSNVFTATFDPDEPLQLVPDLTNKLQTGRYSYTELIAYAQDKYKNTRAKRILDNIIREEEVGGNLIVLDNATKKLKLIRR